MPINLSHREVRDLAKNLRDLTGRDIKHTQILEAIAKAVGRPADSMMHELKNEGVLASEPGVQKAHDPDHMVLRLGFEQSPNGRRGRWIMRVLERRDPAPATLDVVIEPIGDLRWLPHLDPAQPMWSVKAIHTSRAWSMDRVERIVGSAGTDGLSLLNAISLAFEFIGARHHLWSNADALQAEYELDELNPLAAAELRRRNSDQSAAGALSPYERARSLGFDVIADEEGRRVLKDLGPVRWRGIRYRLVIDSDDPLGLSAPVDQNIWSLSMIFTDIDGNEWRAPERLFSSLTLDEACSKTEEFRTNPRGHSNAVAEILNMPASRGERAMTPEDSKRIAKQAGFAIWDTGGGCLAFAKLLREEDTPGGDKVSMDIMITIEGGCSIDASPDEKVWGAGINFTDPRGGESPLKTDTDDLTLDEAISVAREFEQQAQRVWDENYDADAIAEHENRFRG